MEEQLRGDGWGGWWGGCAGAGGAAIGAGGLVTVSLLAELGCPPSVASHHPEFHTDRGLVG